MKSEKLFASGGLTGKLRETSEVNEQVGVLLRTGSLEDAALAMERVEELVQVLKQPFKDEALAA